MSEAAKPSVPQGRKSRRLIVWAAVILVLVLCLAGLFSYLRSAQFEEVVRQRVIAAVERGTGGRVELGSFRWKLSRLQFEATNFVVHGTEPAGERPYISIAQVNARLRLRSLAESRIDLASLSVDKPQIHVIRHPDGSTNIPEPKVPSASSRETLDELFDLAIGRTQVSEGLLQLNDEKLPFEFLADGVRAAESYSRRDKRYDASLHVGKINVRYQDLRELPLQADLDASLWRNRAQVKNLKLRSQNSTLELSTSIDNFDDPRASFQYELYADLAQAASIARLRGVGRGTARFKGEGSYAAGQFTTSGKLQVRDFDYANGAMELRRASAASDYSFDHQSLELKKISAHLFGGDVSGDASVKNLVAARTAVPSQPSKPGARISTPVEEGSVRLKLAGISVEELAHALSTRSFRLDQLGLQASANGTVDASWRDSVSRTSAEVALDFTPPGEPGAGKVPVSGQLRGTFNLRDDSLLLQTLALATPQSQVQASGRMANNASLDVDFRTSSLSEVKGMVAALSGRELPVSLSGQARFNGKLSGKLSQPTIAGHLQANSFSFQYTGEGAAAATAPSRRIELDTLSTELQYSPDALVLRQFVAKQGEAAAALDGSVSLERGDFGDASPFHVKGSLTNFDAARLQHLLGTDFPVTGTLNALLQADGSKANPRANGTISLTDGQAYGRPVESATSHFVFANQKVAFSDIRVKLLAGTLLGSAGYDLNSKSYTAEVHGDNLDLAKIPDLQREKLATAGRGTLTASFSGTEQQPVINGHLSVNDLALNGDKVGAFTVDAATHGEQLQLTAHSSFQKAQLDVSGGIRLRGDLQSDINAQLSDFDIDPFLPAELKQHITGHSGVVGKAHLSGPLRQPRALTGTVTVDSFAVTLEKIPVKNDGPIELGYANNVVSVKQFALLSTDSRATVAGRIDLNRDQPLDLRVLGTANLLLAQTFDPDLTSSGTASIDATVRGTLRDPSLNGKVTISKGAFANIDLPAALADLNGTLVFNQNRLEIEQLTGRIGGGHVSFGGYISYGRMIGFDLTSQGTDIRFRYAGLSVTADQELRLQGTLKNSTASGTITITRFSQIPSADLTQLFGSGPTPVPSAASPLNNLHLEIRILSSPDLTVSTSLAKLSGDADLRLRGTAMRPVLFGRVNLAEGDVKLNGSKYRLERADITFANPVRIDPILDVEATTRVRDFDITIGLHGTIERLVTTYRSDPPLSSDDIIALLAFGRTQTENSLSASGSNTGFGEAASSAVLGAAINQAVSNRVSRLFGVSSIRINPGAGGPDNNPNARLTVEQQVSKDVTITYITNLARSSQQVIQFEYNISRDYTVEAIRDENGVLSFDVLIRKRKN